MGERGKLGKNQKEVVTMPNGPRLLMENVCYHIIARGNQKRVIFREGQDFEEYLERVAMYKRKHGFRLYGFCLMPNHVHILGEIEKKEDLAKFMQGLTLSYTIYFNKKYEKVGYLWQGRFKSKVILKDDYLMDCLSYIEMNPLRANIAATPHQYPWSSYRERNLEGGSEKRLLTPLELL